MARTPFATSAPTSSGPKSEGIAPLTLTARAEAGLAP